MVTFCGHYCIFLTIVFLGFMKKSHIFVQSFEIKKIFNVNAINIVYGKKECFAW